MSEDVKKGRGKRVAGYFGRRIGNPFIQKVGRETMEGSRDVVRRTFRVEKLSREEVRNGIQGRYKDGGRQRFREMYSSRGLGESDLDGLARNRERQALAMTAVAVFALISGAAAPFFTDVFVISLSGLVFGVFSLAFLAIAFRHDYAAWQIRARRFGGVREYIDARWGGSRQGGEDRVPTTTGSNDVRKR